jgi:hypothetical protein
MTRTSLPRRGNVYRIEKRHYMLHFHERKYHAAAYTK